MNCIRLYYLRNRVSQTVDNECLFKRYPIIWQGCLGLKSDLATVQLHHLSGSFEIDQNTFNPPKTHLVDGVFRWCAPILKMNKSMTIQNPEVSFEKLMDFKIE